MMDTDAIKVHAVGLWSGIIQALAPQLTPTIERDRKHGPCPLCEGKDRCRCHNDFQETGGIICNQCGGAADGLGVLMWANGWDFPTTIKAVSSYLGLGGGQIPTAKPVIQKTKQSPKNNWDDERQRLKVVWGGTVKDTGRIAQYFKHRSLSIPVPDTLRLHPSLSYFQQGPPISYPCMVAKIIRGDEAAGLHRTWLDPDGLGKAPCSQPRKTWKCTESMSGGAIRLYPLEEGKPLIVCEGIETALAVREITGLPVWSAISSTMLEKVQIPKSIEPVIICADKDRSITGERAAAKLAQRLTDEGHQVKISLPPIEIPEEEKSVDWLDYLNSKEVACV
jgi:putative DNA primase/helicase